MGHMKDRDVKSLGLRTVGRMAALLLAVIAFGIGAKHRHSREHEGGDGHDGHESGTDSHGHRCRCKGKCCGERVHLGGNLRNDPLKILELRYASGKIDEEEFRRRRSVLQENLQ
jgi:hypothetical protein